MINYSGRIAALMTVGAIAVGDTLMAFAAVNPEATNPVPNQSQLAQGLIGQCRATNRAITVYSDRSTSSAVVGTLAINTSVTLSGNGLNGFIGISAPVTGFVQAAFLKACAGTTPPTGNTCRRVITSEGVLIRSEPNRNATQVGFASFNQQVTLTADPPQTSRDSEGRTWVAIAGPARGWLSNGFAGASNLGQCSTTPPPPVGSTCTVRAANGLITRTSPTGAVAPPGLAFGQTVRTTGQRQVIGDRVWIQISAPYSAWVSTGFVNSETNFNPIPCR